MTTDFRLNRLVVPHPALLHETLNISLWVLPQIRPNLLSYFLLTKSLFHHHISHHSSPLINAFQPSFFLSHLNLLPRGSLRYCYQDYLLKLPRVQGVSFPHCSLNSGLGKGSIISPPESQKGLRMSSLDSMVNACMVTMSG